MRRVLLPLLAIGLFAGMVHSLVGLLATAPKVSHGPRQARVFQPQETFEERVFPAGVEPTPPLRRSYPDPESCIVISEVHYHPAGDDPRDEWIELFNRGEAAVDLGGWKLVEGVSFTFPEGTRIEPGGYLVACADRSRIRDAFGIENVAGDWTGSLKNGGEVVRLVSSRERDVDSIAYEDEPPFPLLADGLGSSLERRNPHLPGASPANWGAGGTAGWTRVRARGTAASNRFYIYLLGAGEAHIDDLSIRPSGRDENLLSDGGFEKERGGWSFEGNHSRSRIDSGRARSGGSSLKVVASGPGATRGTAIVGSLPRIVRGETYEVEFWALFPRPAVPLVLRFSSAREGDGGIYVEARPGGFTPGRTNSVHAEEPPPFVFPVRHEPERPGPGDPVAIQATVFALRPLREVAVILDEGRERRIPLLEQGKERGKSQGFPGHAERLFSATLGTFAPGDLVRYKVVAVDDAGETGSFPPPGDPTRARAFYVERQDLAEPVPPGVAVYHFLIDPALVQALDSNPYTDAYVPGAFIDDGRVHCDVGFRYRGQTSRWIPKHHWKVRFNKDQPFAAAEPPRHRARVINLNSAYGDKSFLREMLGFQLWRDMGEAYCETWHARVYLNGAYLGFYVQVENPGGDFLSRNRLEEGWLWKCYSGGSRADGGFELKAGDPSTAGEVLQEFLDGLRRLSGAELEAFIREHMNVESFLDYLAGCQLIHNADHIAKNYLLYADGEKKFTMFPWDLDLTHGRNYECSGGGIWNDVIRHDMWDDEAGDEALLFGTRKHPKCGDSWNLVIDAFLLKATAFRPLYWQRVSEHLAHHYHPDVLVPRIEELREMLREEVRRDRGQWGAYGGDLDFDRQCDLLVRWAGRRFQHLSSKLRHLGHPVGNPLNARFEASVQSGPAPLRVAFTSLCVGRVDALEWDFGDGSRSDAARPEHVYEKPGIHDVSLKVSGPDGVHETARRGFIEVLPP